MVLEQNRIKLKKASDRLRQTGFSQTGRIVFDYIVDSAAILKRMFVADTELRLNRANQVFDNPIENDECFAYLNTRNNRTVLKFCGNCRGQYFFLNTTNNLLR